MDRVEVGTILMTWDPKVRLAHLRFTAPTHAGEEDAKKLVAAITEWVGTDAKPFALLGDGGKLGAVDASYRSVWGAFFKKHKKEGLLAFYNMGPLIRIAAEMFRIGTGVTMKAFANEEEARAWLRKAGIGA